MRISDWSSDVCSSDLGEQGGWPLTMFLTPKGEPFWGGTYFPAEAKFGRPAFTEVLEKVSEAYHQNKSAIAQNVRMLVGGLRNMAKPQSRDRLALSNDALDQVAGQLLGNVDPQHRQEEHTSALQALMRHSYAACCL